MATKRSTRNALERNHEKYEPQRVVEQALLATMIPDEAEAEPKSPTGANPASVPGKTAATVSDATIACDARARAACARLEGA